MARAPFAVWKGPVPNKGAGGLQRPVMGLVLHIMEGTQEGTDSWFHNPQSKVSAHFGNAKDGRLWQWVDTDDKSWAQTGGNTRWVSVENEGHSGDRLTAAQLTNCAHLMTWLHETEGVPLQSTDSPTTPGLGWHGMAGGIWGHPDCPGAPIVAQRADIIESAKGDDMPTLEEIAAVVQREIKKALDLQGVSGAADPRNDVVKAVIAHGDANWRKG